MATTIKLKNGSGAPLAGDLVQGEPALDLTNKRLYTENASGTVIEVGTNPTSLTTGTFTSTGIDDNATSTAITIDSSGDVGFNTASPNLHGWAKAVTLDTATNAGYELGQSGTKYGAFALQADGRVQITNFTANPLTFQTNNTEQMRIDSSGNVGIGTPTTTATRLTATTATANHVGLLVENSNTADSFGMVVKAGNDANDYTADFRKRDNTNIMRIRGDGNVGIGTTSPITPLDVFGKQRIYLNNTNVGNASSLQLTQDGTGDAAISFLIGATTEWLAGVDNSDSDKFKISNITGGSDFTATGMTIDSSGNVGIGTASPSAKLDISGAAPVLELTDTGSTASYGWQPTANDLRLFDFNASLERLRIDSSGNVGIGTTSPNATLAFGGSSDVAFNTSLGSTGTYGQIKAFNTLAPSNPATNIRFIRDVASVGNDGAICFDTVNTERMRIDSSGKLLVGKTSSSITTAGTEITSSSLLQSVSDTSTNLATNGGAALNLCNTSATNGNFSNIGGYNSNGLVVSQMNFINLNHASRTGAITLSTHDGTSLNEAMRIDSSGRVGIGTTSPNAKLTVDGQGAFGSADASGNGIYLYVSGALSDNSYMSRSSSGTGTTTWYIGNQSITTSSDVRLKDNIVDSERNAVEIINNLRVVDHTWNDPSDQSVNNKNSRGVWTGLIAQEAVEHIPWLVNRPLEDVDENGYENYWHMDYGYAVPLLIKAIQEQQAMIEILQAEVAALKGA